MESGGKMSFAERLRAVFGPVGKSGPGTLQSPSEPFLELVGGGRTPSGERVTDSSALCISAVYACVQVKAEDFGKLPVNLWRRRQDGGREPARDHPLYGIFKGLTFDGRVGLSPLAQMRTTIGNAIAGEKLSGYMMANGASPSGVLVHPKTLSDTAARRLEKSWAERQAGPANAGKTPVLEEGMEWKAVGMSSVDAQFLEQRKFSIEEIARAFRVPLSMIGMLDRMTNNNASEAARSYYDQSLMPVLEAFEAEYSRAFDLPEDIFVEFDVNRLLRANFKARQEGNRMQVMGGAMSPNEWRLEEGRNPTAGGDVFARPLNTAFVDANGNHIMTTPAGGNDPVFNSDESAASAEEGA